jgi:exosortase family protein XrtF
MSNQASLYQQYKPTIVFIAKFAFIYLVLAGLYALYIGSFAGKTDSLTRFVGKSVSAVYRFLGTEAQTIPLENESGLKLVLNGNYLARIVEGCTAASVIIMFIAFVISFGNKMKQSLAFAIVGSVLIFAFNIIRIVFLGYILHVAPQYQDISHRVLFPAMIYGFVILLWIVFIKKWNPDAK